MAPVAPCPRGTEYDAGDAALAQTNSIRGLSSATSWQIHLSSLFDMPIAVAVHIPWVVVGAKTVWEYVLYSTVWWAYDETQQQAGRGEEQFPSEFAVPVLRISASCLARPLGLADVFCRWLLLYFSFPSALFVASAHTQPFAICSLYPFGFGCGAWLPCELGPLMPLSTRTSNIGQIDCERWPVRTEANRG